MSASDSKGYVNSWDLRRVRVAISGLSLWPRVCHGGLARLFQRYRERRGPHCSPRADSYEHRRRVRALRPSWRHARRIAHGDHCETLKWTCYLMTDAKGK